MIVCSCNPFDGCKLKSVISNNAGEKRVSKIYKKCSGGASPSCGNCIDYIRKR